MVAKPIGVDAPGGTARPGPPARSAEAQTPAVRRAAAARRRLVLTILLLMASAGAWVAVSLGSARWLFAAIPTVLLVLVLVLGRRAVILGNRADARRAAARGSDDAERGTASTRRKAADGGRPSDSTARTQSAVRPGPVPRVPAAPQHAVTEIIPRLVPVKSTGAAETSEPTAAESPTANAKQDAGEEDSDAQGASDVRERSEEQLVIQASDTPEPETDPVHIPSGRAWDPIPVPPPTYTLKAAAPRREPTPLSATDVVTGKSAQAEAALAAGTAESKPAGTVTAVTVLAKPDASELAEAHSDVGGSAGGEVDDDAGTPAVAPVTLGLDLNEILARRRAAGQ